MGKKSLFIGFFSLALAGCGNSLELKCSSSSIIKCGQKSVIENATKPQTTAERYGDGTYSVHTLVLPLSDQTIGSFNSPLEKMSYITGGFAKMFMNVGASMGMGKMQLSLIQPMPKLPAEYIKEIRIKRLFFYIEPTQEGAREQSWVKRILKGRDDVNFEFIDKIAVKLSPHKLENTETWTPILAQQEMLGHEYDFLKSLFRGDYFEAPEAEAREMILMKYEEDEKERYLKKKTGKTHILNVTNPKKAGQARRFFVDHPKLKGSFKSVLLLNNSLIIELLNDRIIEENFNTIVSLEAQKIQDLGNIEQCTVATCLDFDVPYKNLFPLISKSNGIRLDAYIDADKVPDSFQLKGYIEFETKLNLGF